MVQALVSSFTHAGEFMGKDGQDNFVPAGNFGILRMLALHDPQLLTEDEYLQVLTPLDVCAVANAGAQ